MNVAAGVAPDVNADGKCSLNEAIFNANNNRAMYPDCPAGSGNDALVGGGGTDICNGGTNTDTATLCETVVGVP